METTKEEREWLRLNWSVGEPSFRQWVAGSDKAHEIVPRALRDVAALVAALRDAAEEMEWLGASAKLDSAHRLEIAGLQDKLLNIWQRLRAAVVKARAVLGE